MLFTLLGYASKIVCSESIDASPMNGEAIVYITLPIEAHVGQKIKIEYESLDVTEVFIDEGDDYSPAISKNMLGSGYEVMSILNITEITLKAISNENFSISKVAVCQDEECYGWEVCVDTMTEVLVETSSSSATAQETTEAMNCPFVPIYFDAQGNTLLYERQDIIIQDAAGYTLFVKFMANVELQQDIYITLTSLNGTVVELTSSQAELEQFGVLLTILDVSQIRMYVETENGKTDQFDVWFDRFEVCNALNSCMGFNACPTLTTTMDITIETTSAVKEWTLETMMMTTETMTTQLMTTQLMTIEVPSMSSSTTAARTTDLTVVIMSSEATAIAFPETKEMSMETASLVEHSSVFTIHLV